MPVVLQLFVQISSFLTQFPIPFTSKFGWKRGGKLSEERRYLILSKTNKSKRFPMPILAQTFKLGNKKNLFFSKIFLKTTYFFIKP